MGCLDSLVPLSEGNLQFEFFDKSRQKVWLVRYECVEQSDTFGKQTKTLEAFYLSEDRVYIVPRNLSEFGY